MKKNSLVKIAFVTCEPMSSKENRLYLCLIYDVSRNTGDCKNYVEEQLLSGGYAPVEFWELPPLPYSTACAMARNNELYINGLSLVDLELYSKHDHPLLHTLKKSA